MRLRRSSQAQRLAFMVQTAHQNIELSAPLQHRVESACPQATVLLPTVRTVDSTSELQARPNEMLSFIRVILYKTPTPPTSFQFPNEYQGCPGCTRHAQIASPLLQECEASSRLSRLHLRRAQPTWGTPASWKEPQVPLSPCVVWLAPFLVPWPSQECENPL